MKTKIGLPFGLALVMFIGIFTTMLALGALSPSKAQAVGGDFDVTLSNYIPGHYSDWSFTVTTALGFSGEDTDEVDPDTITITFPPNFDVDEDGVAVEANWMLGGMVPSEVVVSTPDVTLTANADMKEVAASAGGEITVVFTAPRKGLAATADPSAMRGIINPEATVAVDERTGVMLSVVTSKGLWPW
jgi:hypothetical protein